MKCNILLMLAILASSLSSAQAIKMGEKQYVPIHELSPGQLRFTKVNVDTKAKKLARSKGQFDQGRSSLDTKDAVPVILGPEGLIILVDSHHELMAAKKVGDETAPITVVDDLRHLSREEFFTQAVAKNYIYPYNRLGTIVAMPATGWYAWDQMEDDPNRLFASLTAWKCTDETTGTKDPNASEDPDYPLWVKKLKERVKIAFIEFKIATVLYKAGLEYQYSWGTNPNSRQLLEFTNHARAALRAALVKKEISPFDLIPEPIYRNEINKNKGGICTYTYKPMRYTRK
jgi:hypothetical protein